jgi:hypothetical protein
MPLRRRLLIASLLALLIGLFALWIAPFAIARGVKTWLWWQARRQGLQIEVGKIDAPLLRPVVLQQVHVISAANAPCRIDLKANRAIVDLQLARILTGASGRALRALAIDELHVETLCHAENVAERSKLSWSTLEKLLPENFKIDKLDLRVENGSTVALLRKGSLSASPISGGHFHVGELMISSPLFRQTFADLSGATAWHDNRLVLGGFTLARGLAVQSMTTDLSHLRKQNVGMEFDIDAFGGKLRASASNEWHAKASSWNIAGSATAISLAQTSEAFGFTNRIGGMVHAGKFTFRGNTRDLSHATASIWLELTGSSWAGRTSEVIMVGAALYNRQIQLQQFYVKQRNNQLTMSGEGAIPSNTSDWLSPDFRGDISASIHDLGDFAGLFGAERGNFAGEIAIEGTMNARDRKIGGHLALTGAGLTIFKTSIAAFNARLNLRPPELEIEQFDLKRKNDSLSAQGKIDMSHEHNYSGTLHASVRNVAEYVSIFRGPPGTESKPASVEIEANVDAATWNARGVLNLPGSSPFNFTASFPLRIGMDWNSFLSAPIKVDLDFPSIFLANAPQFLHPDIFRDGILSGKLSLSETLQHPRINGDVQLLNGKLQNAPFNLTEANGRLTFNGDRAAVDSLNAATKDVDLSFRGDVDLHDSNALVVNLFSLVPIFDSTPRDLDCASKIEFAPTGLTLAPPIAELEFHGGLFRSDWSVNLKTRATQAPDALNEVARTIRLCPGRGVDEKVLSLGAHPRPEPTKPRKRSKRR